MSHEGITKDEREVLALALAEPSPGQVEVQKIRNEPNAHYDAARSLERAGLLRWVRCSGTSIRGRQGISIRYELTPDGALVARSAP
jgi:hypothetical protein